MGWFQFYEKLASRLKIGITAKQFCNESRAVGFCKHAADVVVVQFFIKFLTARESNDRQTFKWI